MSDLTERLRQPVMLHSNAEQTNAERAEAAAEIERLRTRNAALVEALRSHNCLVDNRATVGECQQCGCTDGLLIKPIDEQVVAGTPTPEASD